MRGIVKIFLGGAATDAADRGRLDQMILSGERVGIRVAARPGYHRAGNVSVSDLREIGSARVLARCRPGLGRYKSSARTVAPLIDNAGENVGKAGVLIEIKACCAIGVRHRRQVAVGAIGVG